jgi:hypothetical protein
MRSVFGAQRGVENRPVSLTGKVLRCMGCYDASRPSRAESLPSLPDLPMAEMPIEHPPTLYNTIRLSNIGFPDGTIEGSRVVG